MFLYRIISKFYSNEVYDNVKAEISVFGGGLIFDLGDDFTTSKVQ